VWQLTEARYDVAGGGFQRTAVADRIRHITGRIGVPMIDLTPALREVEGFWTPTYFPTDSHWNARGQDVAARALADFLARGGFLPPCR
jgi:hypothetical protein